MVMGNARSIAIPAREQGLRFVPTSVPFEVFISSICLYVATYEAMANAKRVTPALIQRMCVSHTSMHIGYT